VGWPDRSRGVGGTRFGRVGVFSADRASQSVPGMSRWSPFIRVASDPDSDWLRFEPARRVTAAPPMANGSFKLDDSSDDEFYGAEDRSCSGDSEFHDAVDFQG